MGGGSHRVSELPSRAPKGSSPWLHLDLRWRLAPSWAVLACVGLGRKGGLGAAQLPPLKPEGTGAFGEEYPQPGDPACPSWLCPETAITIPGDSSVFMFHPGLPAAECPPGRAGGQAAQGFWDQVLLLCASSLPGRCDSCSLGKESCVAGVLGLACGIWEAQLPGRPPLGYPLCWQGPFAGS